MALSKSVGDSLSAIDFNAVQLASQGNAVLSGYTVIENTVVDMNIIVQSGRAKVNGSVTSNANNQTLAISTAHATLDRIDTVSVQSNGVARVTAGTAASTNTVVPADIPTGDIPLATVSIPAADVTISNNQITDRTVNYSDRGLESSNISSGWTGTFGVVRGATNLYVGINQETIDSCDVITGWTDSADMTISVNSGSLLYSTNALNLTKDGTSSVNASTSKTVTSRDFADSDDDLEMGLYIKDQTTHDKLATSSSVIIRYGSDSSNYYQWNWDKANISVGVNTLCCMTVANADSTTGSPDTANMDYFFIQYTTNNTSDTTVAGDIVMDEIHITNGGIVAFDSKQGKEIEMYTRFYVEVGTPAQTVRWAFYIDGVLQTASKGSKSTGAEEVFTNRHINNTVSKSDNHVVKAMFVTGNTVSLPSDVDNTNILWARELAIN
jgi:hypothetical protein